MYHRCMELEHIVFGEIVPRRDFEKHDFQYALDWLENEVGFYPLFLGFGETEDDIGITGYQNQWRVRISSTFKDGKISGEYRKKCEFPNHVLFSFDELEGVFLDYDYWHIVLNSTGTEITEQEKRWIFKYSWDKNKWKRKARTNPGTVQFVVPRLDLRTSKRIFCRNNRTRNLLEEMGFNNVEVKRIKVDGL